MKGNHVYIRSKVSFSYLLFIHIKCTWHPTRASRLHTRAWTKTLPKTHPTAWAWSMTCMLRPDLWICFHKFCKSKRWLSVRKQFAQQRANWHLPEAPPPINPGGGGGTWQLSESILNIQRQWREHANRTVLHLLCPQSKGKRTHILFKL